jgi:hypothetical protein
MTPADLQKVRDWAHSKLATGDEPPWAWYQYMKLQETLDAIIGGMSSWVTPEESTKESLRQEEQRQGKHLRLVADKRSQDTAPPHPVDEPVQLPM